MDKNIFLAYLSNMSQVSKRYLKPEISDKILEVFFSSFNKLRNKTTAKMFFEEFLSPTEKIMLSKRVVCLYLLYKKIPINEISDVIKVSTSTIVSYHILLDRSKTIKKILEEILKEEELKRSIDTLINEYIFPPMMVGRNWSNSLSAYHEYKKRKDSPL